MARPGCCWRPVTDTVRGSHLGLSFTAISLIKTSPEGPITPKVNRKWSICSYSGFSECENISLPISSIFVCSLDQGKHVFCESINYAIGDWSLITDRGEVATKRELGGGACEFFPYKKGGGGG